jgi:hypothetical protein
MISLSIVAILLGSVFTFFSQITRFEKKMMVAKEHVLEKNLLEIRLGGIFSQIIYKNFSKEPIFYTEGNSLFFHFDNGIDTTSFLSSVVAAKIFIDSKNNLILKIMPIDKDQEKIKFSREEILAKNVSDLHFEFLKKITPETPGPKKNYKTSTTWDKEQKNIPAEIKIYLKNGKKEDLIFPFFLPSKESFITYYDEEKL